jgi:hypothetical protein
MKFLHQPLHKLHMDILSSNTVRRLTTKPVSKVQVHLCLAWSSDTPPEFWSCSILFVRCFLLLWYNDDNEAAASIWVIVVVYDSATATTFWSSCITVSIMAFSCQIYTTPIRKTYTPIQQLSIYSKKPIWYQINKKILDSNKKQETSFVRLWWWGGELTVKANERSSSSTVSVVSTWSVKHKRLVWVRATISRYVFSRYVCSVLCKTTTQNRVAKDGTCAKWNRTRT